MLKSILEALDHTANMFFVILVLWSAIALSIAISVNSITKAVHADIYYQQFGEVKNERVNNSL
ncbi:MAG: hypothetical protein HRU18_24640 [Pseudoalteromonas sp.]|uniref:hypothetical protein n=1 Tax=Pseudoalteromonas sp. TaxID=53249 RepID=UPI001D21A95F|nr:hypothetical protein [Pseudoalteromonas sp.]NRA81398.1 hypothetical protein [Pseudoalteromonas sp.]